MRYEFDVGGETEVVDTNQLDYEAIWDALGLRNGERAGADRIIDLYHLANFNDRILVVTAYSWMKPDNREARRHQADHYRTRSELERVAKDNKLVEKLIDYEILELHPGMRPYFITRKEEEGRTVIGPGHERHPQAPYRLNVSVLRALEANPPTKDEVL